MKFRWDKKYLYWGITAFLVIAAAICFYYIIFHGTNLRSNLSKIISVAMPVIDGLIIAYLMTPLVNLAEKRLFFPLLKKAGAELTVKVKKMCRAGAIVLSLIVVGICAYGLWVAVIPQLIRSIQSIIFQFPYYVNNLTAWLEDVLSANPELMANLTLTLDDYFNDLSGWLNQVQSLLPQMSEILRTLSSGVFGILRTAWNLIIGLIISIYILASKEKFISQAKKFMYAFFETKRANAIIDDVRLIHRTFGGFIGGKIVDSIIIGILCFIVISFIGTPFPMLISVIVGVTNVIPFFGPYIGAIPSAILILMVDPLQCLYFVIFIFLLQQFDGNFLGPWILGDSTGLSSFWVIFSITIFGGLIGVPGMVIGVPTFAVIYTLVKRRVNNNLRKKGYTTETADYDGLGSIKPGSGEFVAYNTEEYRRKKMSLKKKKEHEEAPVSEKERSDSKDSSDD